ncbi:hypothetical protein [Tunturibacter empetritectus]|uniref:hypothetical protein n=1 Tax=Tunturiibacter empetritectus TaxID=3069691 RepID=UPI001C855C25|nr:hypothetical protein [Edaphobacter lichenicola]
MSEEHFGDVSLRECCSIVFAKEVPDELWCQHCFLSRQVDIPVIGQGAHDSKP